MVKQKPKEKSEIRGASRMNRRGRRTVARQNAIDYDGYTRELRLGGAVILPLGLRSDNPAELVAAFEDEHWARLIENPLGSAAVQSRAQQLRDAVYQLNRAQKIASGQLFVRFRAAGKGRFVLHELTQAGKRLCRRRERRHH